MPATSSGYGSTPETVARKQVKTKTAPKTPVRTPVQRQTIQAVRPSAPPSSPTSATPVSRRSVSRASPKRPQPTEQLQTYKPPKVVSKRVKAELKKLDTARALRAASKPIKVAPHLETLFKVTPKATLASPKAIRKAVSTLPKDRQLQAAQKLKVKAQGQKPPKPQKPKPAKPTPKERKVTQKLRKAAKRSKAGVLQKLDRPFAPGETIKPHQAALLAESVGLPGKTYSQIAHGESGFQPAATNPDDGTPGLWQPTPSVQSSTTVAAWDAIAKKHPGGYTNPVAGAEQAAYLAQGGTGVSNYYGTGYMTNPDAHLPGGPAKAAAKLQGTPKPIPQALKAKAKAVLGPKATQKVIAKAKQPPTPTSAAPKKLGGPLGGSREMVRLIVGSKVKGDHGTKNEGTIHSATGDHYGPGSYAQDINQPQGNPQEGEPPYTQATLDKMVANLNKLGADVPALKIGENWSGSVKGYDVQLLTNEGGTISHIHIGAHWSGTPTTSTGVSGSAASVGAAAASTTGTQTGTSPASKSSRHHKKVKRRRRRQAAQIKLSAAPAALDPADYQVKPQTETYADYVKAQTQKVSL